MTDYTFNAYDSYGDGWNGGGYEIVCTLDGTVIANNGGNTPDNGSAGSGDLESSEVFTADCESVAIPGCTDAAACNYDETARRR